MNLSKNEQGVAPIIITTFIIIILTLISVGFARLVSREQRKVLDRELSTQAYYAAESGVNDAQKTINSPAFNPAVDYTSDCNRFISDYGLSNTSGVISYSCLLVDPSPMTIEKSPVGSEQSYGVQVMSASGAPLGYVQVSWEDTGGGTTFSGAGTFDFPTYSAWSGVSNTGVMRAALTPLTSVTRANLQNNTFTAMLYPKAGGGVPTYGYQSGPTNQGQILDGQCSASRTPPHYRYCNAKIDVRGLSQNRYFLRLKSFYRPSTVTISAYDGAGVQLRLKGGQAQVDATGKANDVLRRIQVRIPVGADYPFPEAAIDSAETLCKRFLGWPTTAGGPGNAMPPVGYNNASCDLN